MKGSLFLYSDQIIPENRKLDYRLMSCLKSSRPKIAYIASAPDPQKQYYSERLRYYQLIGAQLVSYYDEYSIFDKESGRGFCCYDAVHLSGGNTYEFLEWIKRIGIFGSLISYAKGGGVLIGTSAGSLLLSPSIDTAALCGDTNSVNIENTEALSLTDFYLWPHYKQCLDKEQINDVGLPSGSEVYCLPDGAGVAMINNEIEIYGDVSIYTTQASY